MIVRHFLNLFLASSLTLGAQVTVLSHATIIDGTGRPALPDASIVVSGGRILEIGPAAKLKAPAGAQVVDLTGKTIIPGIINLHGHVGDHVAANLRTYALYGVTSVMSLGGDGAEALKVREEQKQGRIAGARIYTAQKRFEPDEKVATAEQARAETDRLAQSGADLIKVWVDSRHGTLTKLTPAFCAAVIEEAHKLHLKAFAHIYEYSDAKFLVDENIDVLAHEARDAEVDDAFIAELKQKGVTVIPTLVREQSTYIFADSPAWLSDPLLLKLAPPQKIAAATAVKAQQAKDPEMATNRRDFEMAARNFKKMVNAGVRIGLGTDSAEAPTRFQGFYEHREMELMVEAGMTPMQVIQAFSKTNAEALGIEKDFGTLARGKVADLVVLDRNPLDSILNTRAIHAVYVDGRKFE